MSDPLEDLGRHQQGKAPPPPPPAGQAEIRRRQRSRAIVMALLLGLFVVLMFGISIAKMKNGG
jgi:hypothetical protein